MKLLNRHILTKVLDSEVVGGPPEPVPPFTGISIDSRTIRPGEIFFAIVGDKNDGHDYIVGAFEKGAAAVVINRSRLEQFARPGLGLIYAVENTHEALLNLAAYIRRHIDARFAAVTGSNGKTTTKEMLYSIVNVAHRSFRSPGNLNNLFGLPISLGMMPDDAEFAVFELGISVPGEMTRLASVIKPELAVITNIGLAHLETLKTVENIVTAKFELIDNLPVGAVVVLNADDPYLINEARRRHLEYIGFGITEDCRFRASNIRLDESGSQLFDVDGQTVALPTLGRVNLYNALAAIAASAVWGCTPEQWCEGLAGFMPVALRLSVEEYQGLMLLIDCYNANPGSMAASLETLRELPTSGRRLAVLADMLELGEQSQQLHYDVGRLVATGVVDRLFCLGPQSMHLAAGARDGGMDETAVRHFAAHQELLDALLAEVTKGDAILFKGSRGMEVEKILFGLKGSAFKNN